MAKLRAQTCEYIENEDGERQRRLVQIDGETHFVFPEKKGRKLLEDVKTLESYKVELKFKEQKISLLQERIDLFKQRADLWKRHYQTERDLVKTIVKETESSNMILDQGWVQFGIGFIIASGLYAGWQASYQNF